MGGISNILIAAVIVFGGFWLIRKFGKTPPKAIPALSKRYSGYALVAFSVFLALRGNITAAMPLFALGLALVGIATPFFQGRGWPGSGSSPHADRSNTAPAGAKMSPAEAYAVLGLPVNASAEDIKNAHRRLMKEYHPDKGGSDYLAAKVNQAKDVLTG